jgi:glucose-6-phosphate-specific signal transduction histidine kinase
MRERIGALGGTLELTSAGGARVAATVPRAADKVTN